MQPLLARILPPLRAAPARGPGGRLSCWTSEPGWASSWFRLRRPPSGCRRPRRLGGARRSAPPPPAPRERGNRPRRHGRARRVSTCAVPSRWPIRCTRSTTAGIRRGWCGRSPGGWPAPGPASSSWRRSHGNNQAWFSDLGQLYPLPAAVLDSPGVCRNAVLPAFLDLFPNVRCSAFRSQVASPTSTS